MITPQGILEIGARGLKTFQIAISTTSHNITNVHTEGYSRQRAEIATTFPIKLGNHIFGTGNTTAQIVRLRQVTLDTLVRNETSELGRWTQNHETLRTLETDLGDATRGRIGMGLDEFWSGWQDLSANPEDIGARQALVDRAESIADAFHGVVARLDSLNDGLNLSATAGVTEANSYITEIAELNRSISRAEFAGRHANDLRDRRDLLVEKLSKLTDVNVIEQPNGQVDIDVNGDVLVAGETAFTLSSVLNASNHIEVQLGGSPLALTTGRFQGFVESYAQIDATRARVDQLAATLITEVNTLHSTGFDLRGNPAGSFFGGIDAATIGVSAALMADPAQVAASTTAVPGGNDLALAITQLRDKDVLPGGMPISTPRR